LFAITKLNLLEPFGELEVTVVLFLGIQDDFIEFRLDAIHAELLTVLSDLLSGVHVICSIDGD
jgi:hypothetical protein